MSYDRSTFYGIDPDETDHGARQVNEGATQIRGMVGAISSMLDSFVWEGGDAERFMGDWGGSLRPELHKAMDNLQANVDELHRRAQQRREVSS